MIIYGGGGWKIWLAGLAVSLGIFAVLYFTVIKPTTDTANEAIRTGLQQSQQQLDDAKQDAPTLKAKRQLSEAQRLLACVQDAGTDVSAVQDCQAQFGP
jgi:F0F1-type ATP synthase membrane subunit b/b'